MSIKEKVKLSKTAKIITGIALPVIIAAVIYTTVKFIQTGETEYLTGAAVILLVLITALLEWPESVEVTDNELIIRRKGGWRLVIPREEILSVERFHLQFTPRIVGSGGLFGWNGWFLNDQGGFFRSYIGDGQQSFLIRTKSGKKYAASSENSDSILNLLNEKA
jgi:hypothetical protein